jgi:hypothetical protein
LEVDPEFAPAAELYAELALFGRNEDELLGARDALARVVARGGTEPETMLALAKVSSRLGEQSAALEIAEGVAATDSSPETLHAVAVSQLRMSGREDDGASTYFALLERLTPAVADQLWNEIGPIADTAEKRAWEEGDLAARVDLLRGFWTLRAATSAVSVPERLAEHYRRLAVVVDSFPRVSDGSQPGAATLVRDRDPAPFDERGIIYLRHGPPRRRVSSAGELRNPACGGHGPAVYNESWLYEGLDGPPRFVHLLRCRGFPDWIVPYSTPCAPNAGLPGRGNGRRWEQAISYTFDRQTYDDDATLCGSLTPERTRAFARERLAEDSGLPRFDHTLPFAMDLLAFRGDGGLTDLSAPVAIQADSMSGDTLANGELGYTLSMSMFIVDTISHRVDRHDTALDFRASVKPSVGEAVVAHINGTAAPTENALFRLVVRDGRELRRGRVHGAQIRIPSFAGDSLMISSIVLAVPGDSGNWHRGSTSLSIMPIGEFSGGEFRVFYEVYNLAPDSPYQTEILIERATDDLGRTIGEFTPSNQPLIQLRFDGIANPDERGIVSEVRSVDTGLAAGRYRLFVRVTDVQRGAASLSQRLFLVTR